MSEGLDWTEQGPRSRRFGDVYFSAQDGLAESRAVFLQGCGLPDAWAGRERFVVGELGFGTGLNIAALIDLWRRTRPPGGRLHILSIEAFPIGADEAARALGVWPELAEVAERLLADWPDGRRGWRRWDMADWGVTFDLAIDEVASALAAWDGRADAWFLDGFSPATNPAMWSEAVLAAVAARSAPGARAATFTVAGAVRRGLEAAGFAVDKRPGFGRKRERLEARLAGIAPPSPGKPRVAIVGAGIGGAALARAFRALGVQTRVIEGEGPGAGASGNPAALVTPRLDAGFGPPARLHAQAFARAVQLYRGEAAGAVIARGALQLERQARDGDRFDRLAAWDGFADGALARLDADTTADRLDETAAPGALAYRDALVVEPAAVFSAWLEGVDLAPGHAAALERVGDAWRVLDGEGRVLSEAEIVCLAAGPATATWLPGASLRPVRGQVSWVEGVQGGVAAAWGGYAIPIRSGPTRSGVLFGATHDRGDTATELRPGDHARNLTVLAQGRPSLAVRLAQGDAPLQGRAGVRAATPDHLPLAGGLAEPGLLVLAGFGGRGFTLAPLLAEHVAAVALGAPSPLPKDLAALVAPERFGSPGPRKP